MIGEMRLLWWRDAIGEIYEGRTRAHAVATELARTIEIHELPREAFDRMIDARSLDLGDAPPEDLSTVETLRRCDGRRAGGTGISCMRARGAAPAIAQAGTVWGLAGGLLRAAPYHAAEARVMIPRGALSEAGLRPEDLASGAPFRSAGLAASPMARRDARTVADEPSRTAETQPRSPTGCLLSGSGRPVSRQASQVGRRSLRCRSGTVAPRPAAGWLRFAPRLPAGSETPSRSGIFHRHSPSVELFERPRGIGLLSFATPGSVFPTAETARN